MIGPRVAVPSACRSLRRRFSVDPRIHRSIVPLALPHGGVSRTRHPWTAGGSVPATVAPKGSRCRSRPGFRASNEPVREPVRGRRPQGALSERLRLERDPAARGCKNDIPRLGVGRCPARSHSEEWGLLVCCFAPRRIRYSRCSRGPKTARTALAFRATNGLPQGRSIRHLLVLPKEAVRLRRARSSEDARTSAPRGRYG